MANRRPQQNNGRRIDRPKTFGRSGVSPWQGAGPGGGLPNLLPLGGGSTEATLALASNIINLLQPRQNPVPSLLDMPIRRDFGPNMGRFDRGYGPNRMGNQNFRRTGNYNRSGERINNNRKPFRPNDGQRQQNKSSPKKDADSKAKPVKESEQAEKDQDGKDQSEKKDETTEEKKEGPKTRYDDINSQLLKCHICNKSMWDGRSFENHLSGRAHAIMMQKTAESYALTADTMRQEFKIREMKRSRKTGMQPTRDFYCAMCDMYAADGAAHRTTVGHRKLKKYLHPSCTCCHKEMPTRIELDEHRLTAEHLRNMQDKQEVVAKPKPEVMVISTLTMEQSYLRDERQRGRRRDEPADKDKQDDNKDAEKQDGDEVKVKTEDPDQEGVEVKQEEEKKTIDKEGTILDYNEGDDLSGITAEQLPVYSMDRGVGRSFLSDFRCIQCKLCRKLLDTEETAEVHLKTWRHHQLFLRVLNEKSGAQQSTEQQTSESNNKRPLDSEESGNWKRRKTEEDGNEEQEHEQQNGHDDNGMQEQSHEDADGDTEMPPPEELEDWEQSVDEILQDESVEIKEEKPPTPEPVVEPPRQAPQTRSTPRGRGRGRGRRY
ncbi:zinc finger protein on ecdysone puffs [Pectinophora gossypiella]|nr:zinc finger protein on ecdysone puffs [Pectinophora gossypiella]